MIPLIETHLLQVLWQITSSHCFYSVNLKDNKGQISLVTFLLLKLFLIVERLSIDFCLKMTLLLVLCCLHCLFLEISGKPISFVMKKSSQRFWQMVAEVHCILKVSTVSCLQCSQIHTLKTHVSVLPSLGFLKMWVLEGFPRPYQAQDI